MTGSFRLDSLDTWIAYMVVIEICVVRVSRITVLYLHYLLLRKDISLQCFGDSKVVALIESAGRL